MNPNEGLSAFGIWLRGELDRLDMRPIELARATGKSTGTVSDWLNKGQPPSERSLRLVAKALGVPLADAFRAAGRDAPLDLSETSEGDAASPSDIETDPLADPRLRFWAAVEGDLPPGDVEFLREMAQALRERRRREAGVDGVPD